MSHHASDNRHIRFSVRSLLGRRPAALAMLGLPGLALAGPSGEDVVRGEADVSRPDARRTIIDQHTQRAAINWQSFNVDADEYVIFNQLSSSSVVLNRVVGGDASHILGQIESNGQVFLLNPQGVYFGEGAVLDVQGFLGSTLDMDPDDFMTGDYSLTRHADAPASAEVINEGQITAGPGGYVVLAGDYTGNTGIITAQAGKVALVSGNALTLDVEGDGLVSFAVDEATLAEAAGVHNAGSLIADGGMVVMTARVAGDMVASAVNNEGLVRAHSVAERNGEIYLVGHGGDVVNAGTLDADGENADGGGIGIYSDRNVTLADGAVQTAAGSENHSGGVVRAIAENHLDFQVDNTIRATGGVSGGFVEVSGHGSLALRGQVEVGRGGTYLIDPSSINIVAGSGTGSNGTVGVNLIQQQLDAGANVVLAASSQITASATSLNATGSGGLTLGIGTMSAGSGGACGGLNSSYCYGPDPTFTPGEFGTINVSGMSISIGGDLDLIAHSGTVTAGGVLTSNGVITIQADNVTADSLRTSNGSITIQADNVTASYLSAGNHISVDAVTTGNMRGNIDITGAGVVAGGDVSMAAAASYGGGNIDIAGSISAGGAVTLSGHASGGFSSGGNIMIGNGISADAVSLSATGLDGNITVQGGAGIAIQAGNDISITASGANAGGGNVGLGNSSDGLFTAHDVISTNGNISISATQTNAGSGGVIRAGRVNAGGNVTLDADGGNLQGGQIHLGDALNGSMTSRAGVNAGGSVELSAMGEFNAAINAGDINGASITITVDALNAQESGNAFVEVGNLVATAGDIYMEALANSAGGAEARAGAVDGAGTVVLRAVGDFTGAGSASLTAGTVRADNGVHVEAYNSGGLAELNIGAITGAVSADIYHFGSSGSRSVGDISGVSTHLTLDTDIDGDLGSVDIAGDFTYYGSTTALDIVGNLTAGNINIDAASINSIPGVTINGADIIVDAGNISLAGDLLAAGNLSLQGASIVAGNLDATGLVQLQAFGGSHSIGNITGSHVDVHFTVSDNVPVSATVGDITANGGDIVVSIDGGMGTSAGYLQVGNTTAASGDVNLRVFEGATGSPGGSLVAGNISAGQIVNLYAPGNVTAGGITAGGDVTVRAAGTGGNIEVAGPVLTSQDVVFNASGAIGGSALVIGSSTQYANFVTLNGPLQVTDTLHVWSRELNGSSIGTIGSSGNVINSVSLNTTLVTSNDVNIHAGNITGNSFAIGHSGARANNIHVHGDINVTGDVSLWARGAGAGNIVVDGHIRANNISLDASDETRTGANLSLGGATATGSMHLWTLGGDISIGAGNLSADGFIDVNANGGSNHVFTDISASGMHLRFTPGTDGSVDITTGDLLANGNSESRNISLVVDSAFGTASNATVNVGSATATNGNVSVQVFGDATPQHGILNITGPVNAGSSAMLAATEIHTGDMSAAGINIIGGSLNAGNLVAHSLNSESGLFIRTESGTSVGDISAARIYLQTQSGDIVTGNVTANNTMSAASVVMSTNTGGSGGAISINGDLAVSGHGSAMTQLDAAAGGGNTVTVSGNTVITASAAAFSGTTFYDGYASGSTGRAGLIVNAGSGTATFGNINVDAVGEGQVVMMAGNVSAGDVTLHVADGSENGSFNEYCDAMCTITTTNTMTGGQGQVVFVNSGSTAGAVANVGNISVEAGNAAAGFMGYQEVTAGSVAVTATGIVSSYESAGTYMGENVAFTDNVQGGRGEFMIWGADSATVTLGSVNVAAPGSARIDIGAENINIEDLSATATAGSFTHTGERRPGEEQYGDDGPFSGEFGGGPQIDAGTIVGGTASVRIGGYEASPEGSDHVLAGAVNVSGSINANADGSAVINVAANDIAVGGNLAASGAAVIQDGTRTFEHTNASGEPIVDEAVISSEFGLAEVTLIGGSTGTVDTGVITISGPTVGGHIEGGDIRIGGLDLTGTGGHLDVQETSTNLETGEVREFVFQGPALLSGYNIAGTGAVEVAGAMTLDAVGGGGLLVQGDSVNLQDVSINVTEGEYQLLDPNVFGDGLQAFTLGDALLDIHGDTSATIAEDVVVNAARNANIAGNYTAGGSISVSAGNSVTPVIDEALQYLHVIDNEGDIEPLALSGPLDVAATNLHITANAESIGLANATLAASGNLVLAAGGGIDLGGADIAAGTDVSISAGDGISADDETAAVNITTGGALDLDASITAAAITLTGAHVDLNGHALSANDQLTLVANTLDGATGLLSAGRLSIDAPETNGATLLTNTGNMAINVAGALSIDNTAFSGITQLALTSSDLGAVEVNLGGAGVFVDDITADSFTLQANSANFSGQTVNIAGDARFDVAGNLLLNGTTLRAGSVGIIAGGNVTGSTAGGSLTADAVAISAGGNVNLGGTAMTVGDGEAPGAIGDARLLSLLGDEDLAPDANTPNLFVRGNAVTLGALDFNGDYLLLQADDLAFSGAVTTSQADTLVQLAPLAGDATISVVESGDGSGAVSYSNTGHLELFAGRTVALGSTTHTGAVTLSENTPSIDIGSTNLFVLTSGAVNGLGRVASTGVVKDLDGLLGVQFSTPKTDEIDASQDTAQALANEYHVEGGTADELEEEAEDDEEGGDTETESVTEEEDNSLIRKETADEEMMCR